MPNQESGETVKFATPRLDTDELHRRYSTLIVVQGAEIGRHYLLRESTIQLGRSADCDIRLLDDQASRSHAKIDRTWDPENGARYFISDTGSTNGTFVNTRPAQKTNLREGDKIQVGNTVLKYVVLDSIDAKFHSEIRDRITYDALTGLLTKESLYLALASEIRACLDYEVPLAVLMMDLDYFKQVNDTYGHPMGSHVLSQVGRLIRDNVRDLDVTARYGGEEFVTYLSGSDLSGAQVVAERVRRAIEGYEFRLGNQSSRITISIGIATLPEYGRNLDALVAAADRALYAAKARGRNQVALAAEIESAIP
jgi:diguanylate cyclase (GGDEF)-like protein